MIKMMDLQEQNGIMMIFLDSSSLLLDFVTCVVLYFAYQAPHNLHFWRRLLLRSSCTCCRSTIHAKDGVSDVALPPRKDSLQSIDDSYQYAGSCDDDDESVGQTPPPPSPPSPPLLEDAAAKETWLLQEIPESTLAERRRFLLSSLQNKEQAAKNLRTYLDWRIHHQKVEQQEIMIASASKPTGDDDWDVWNKACGIAINATEKEDTSPERILLLPRIIRTHYCTADDNSSSSSTEEVCDVNGQRIFHIMPGQMDSTMASFSTYALAIALYFEFKLQRDSNECITIVVDARGGRGWPNPHATKLLPFIQEIVTILLTLFPERLFRSIVFPVPYCFCWIWNLVQKTCISDVATRQKICLLTGPARIASPPPLQEMFPRYMSEATAQLLERQRLAAFKEDIIM